MARIHQPPSSGRELSEVLRAACARKGWDLQDLARRAGVSRTTLYHWQCGRTRIPRAKTLGRIASALEIPVDDLVGHEPRLAERDPSSSSRTFDKLTNHLVGTLMRERPSLFAGWTEEDRAELFSMFGTGGHLNSQGAVAAAEAINRKRETIRKLHVVLETHLRERAIDLIDCLYDLVRVPASPVGS